MPAPVAAAAALAKKKALAKAVKWGISAVFVFVIGMAGVLVALGQAAQAACDSVGGGAGIGVSSAGLPGAGGAAAAGDPDPNELARHMWAKRKTESGDNYRARYNGPGSDASGAYQYISSTWNAPARKAIWSKYGNYPQAYMAPPNVQDEVARADFIQFWRTYRNWFQVSMVHYYPAWVNKPEKWDTVPRPDAGNRLTLRQYANKILNLMGQASDAPPGTDQQSIACQQKVAGTEYVGDGSAGSMVLAAASKYIGIGYKWGGGRVAGQERRGMDCSGFTYSVYRDLGIRINGVTSTQERNGISVGTDLSKARPGDLIMTGRNGPYASSHVLIYHSFQNGKHMVLESTGKGSPCTSDAPRYGANPSCRGIGPPHPFADSRPIVNIRRIVCSVNSAGQVVPCGAGAA